MNKLFCVTVYRHSDNTTARFMVTVPHDCSDSHDSGEAAALKKVRDTEGKGWTCTHNDFLCTTKDNLYMEI